MDILARFRDSHHEFQREGSEFDANNPFELFRVWFEEAAETELEANAFVLTTSDLKNQSSGRIVYLKELIDQEFVFYTNYNSQKGQNIAENPKVSMLFFWPKLSRQVRIDGVCSKVAAEVSDEYFNSRPRGSKIGAWASNQSEELNSREELEKRVEEFDAKYPGEDVPRPIHWGGYKIDPVMFEFWQGRPSRLHDRLMFSHDGGENWKIVRKNP